MPPLFIPLATALKYCLLGYVHILIVFNHFNKSRPDFIPANKNESELSRKHNIKLLKVKQIMVFSNKMKYFLVFSWKITFWLLPHWPCRRLVFEKFHPWELAMIIRTEISLFRKTKSLRKSSRIRIWMRKWKAYYMVGPRIKVWKITWIESASFTTICNFNLSEMLIKGGMEQTSYVIFHTHMWSSRCNRQFVNVVFILIFYLFLIQFFIDCK